MIVAVSLYSAEALRIAISDPGRAGLRLQNELRRLFPGWNLGGVHRRLGFRVRNSVFRNRPIQVGIAGHALRLVPEGAIAEGFWSGMTHESPEVTLICRLLHEDSVFLDIGANVGIFSLAAAKTAPSAKIVAFEPTSETFDRLSRNIRLNDASNVEPLRFAVGKASGTAMLTLNASGKDGLNTLGRPSHPDSEPVGEEVVPVTTLDKFLESFDEQRVDLVKVEAEGAELLIFQGARNLLQRPDAPLMLYEAYPSNTRGFGYHPVEICWYLEGLGFSLFTLDASTGKLAIPKASRAYGCTVVAVKKSHSSYPTVEELIR
jgi:FkbM family methyltransferase